MVGCEEGFSWTGEESPVCSRRNQSLHTLKRTRRNQSLHTLKRNRRNQSLHTLKMNRRRYFKDQRSMMGQHWCHQQWKVKFMKTFLHATLKLKSIFNLTLKLLKTVMTVRRPMEVSQCWTQGKKFGDWIKGQYKNTRNVNWEVLTDPHFFTHNFTCLSPSVLSPSYS